MTKKKFISFYKKRNNLKNHQEAKEKIDLFWDTLLKALEKGEKVTLKNWGTFEKKDVKARKIRIPQMNKTAFTETKKKIKFKAGKGLKKIVNGSDIDE